MTETVLQTRHLVKRFGGITATDDVTLSIAAGARHALIGPNGAGKTTLINLLTGVLPASSGQVLLRGQDISHMAPHRRVGLGLVRTFQINQLFASLTPLQSLALAVASRQGVAQRWWRPMGHDAAIATECEQLLAQFRLSEQADQPTRELAYGKRRLLEIALAVAQRPSVLLLDEPAAGVPAAERQDILATVAALPTDVSVVLIEHDMDLVFSFATTLTVLVNGAVLTSGTPAEIAADERVRAVYLGKSRDAPAPGASAAAATAGAAHGQ